MTGSKFKTIIGFLGLALIPFLSSNGQELVSIIQKPPTQKVTQPSLSLLLQTPDGKPIGSERAWGKERRRLEKEWLELLGPLPKKECELKMEVVSSEDLPDFTRQYIKYQIEDGIYTDGYLLVPKRASTSNPAIVVFHSTVPSQAKMVSGVDLSVPEKAIGLHLVQRGFIVLCPRNFIFNEGADYAGNVKILKKQHPELSGMGRMVWDGIRAVDLLQSLPNVNKERIGVIGHSLGGKEALYSAAFDKRVKAAVSSEGGIGLSFSNWEAEWYLGSAIKKPDFKLENHQVLALVAPRPFLLLAGDASDNDKSWAFIAAAQPVYKLLGAPENLGWFNHHRGHRYPKEARSIAEEFFLTHLKP